MKTSLFHDELDEAPNNPRAKGPFASVVMEQSIDREFDYAIPRSLLTALRPGQRVKVPFGRKNRPAHGYVVSIQPTTDFPSIKPLLAIDDDRVLIAPKMMELARWMSRYYVTPLGTVLESVIPSAVKKRTGLGYVSMVRLAAPREQAQSLLERLRAPKRRALLARLLQLPEGEKIELVRLAAEANAAPATVRQLAKAQVITITTEPDLPQLTASLQPASADESPISLNADQQRVMDSLLPRVQHPGFSVNLLMGVTGSGKTEVYLQAIRQVVNAGRKAIVLVPEIALTPQTKHRFTQRFQRVAVLHSGLTNTGRHRYWQQIAEGHADVVVGARSAIFAPIPNLGIIVVDEEHEASYKQDQAPRYNARDVAIKRAQLEQIPVLLGSATPSLETYWRVTRNTTTPVHTRAQSAHTRAQTADTRAETSDPPAESSEKNPAATDYHLLSLPNRVRGLALPKVQLVDMKNQLRRDKGIHLISQPLENLLKQTLAAKQQAILLLNRRGYSNFVYCRSCGEPIHCKFCDTTMTYHRIVDAEARSARFAEGLHTGQMHCHYCLAVDAVPAGCPVCHKQLSFFGLGTQRVEEELARKLPAVRYARVDRDTMRKSGDYEKTLAAFAKGEIQVMLGTQMIAKGLDYPNVTLVGVISGDTALALPDFRSAERTFQLLTQVAGRAGRGDVPGRVIVQTFLPDDPTIQSALRQDYLGFAQTELLHRREVGLPPWTRMARIILRDQDVEKLSRQADEFAAELSEQVHRLDGLVQMKGPMPCAISRIAGYFRYQIILISPRAAALQQVLSALREQGDLSRTDRIAVDVDPVSLL